MALSRLDIFASQQTIHLEVELIVGFKLEHLAWEHPLLVSNEALEES